MRIFLAGATGVVGTPLLPLLVRAGHTVAGMTRSPGKVDLVRAAGGEAVVCDVFDAELLTAAVVAFAPDMVISQLTDLPDDMTRLADYRDRNARIRREGTANLLAAGRTAGAGRFLAQSVAWDLPDDGGRAAADMERQVLAIGGVVLRYGQLYGPGTYYEDEVPPHPRIYVDEAAARTVAALDHPSAIVMLVEE